MGEFIAGAVLMAFIAFVFYKIKKSRDEKSSDGSGAGGGGSRRGVRQDHK